MHHFCNSSAIPYPLQNHPDVGESSPLKNRLQRGGKSFSPRERSTVRLYFSLYFFLKLIFCETSKKKKGRSKMENSTQTSTTAIVPFISYEQTAHAEFVELQAIDRKVKSAQRKAFNLEVVMVYNKETKRQSFAHSGLAMRGAKLYEDAKASGDKEMTKAMNDKFKSQRIAEWRAYRNLVLSGELEELFNTEIRKTKQGKAITSVGYLLKLVKKAQASLSAKAEQSATDDTAKAETPDVGESSSEPQTEVVSVPQTEEDFVALMIERGLDLNKVVEIIFDLDKQSKVA